MNRPRTLDSMYGTGITPDEAPHVERTVDGEEYMVDVDLTPAATTLLEALAAAIADGPDDALAYEWGVLMFNRAQDPVRRDLAVRELLTNRAVRQALTIRLTPDTAWQLSGDLEDGALEPDRCDQYDQGDKCRYYAAEGETQCPRHLPADPQP